MFNLKMEGHHPLLLALSFGAFAIIIHLVQALPDQQGFISLDGGLPPGESPYTDSVTGLTFSSDADYIRSGKLGEIGVNVSYTYRRHKNLRYFPDGTRNCYDLTVNKGINYLIRAEFLYGNYDGLKVYPKFHMYIGPNMWTEVDLGSDKTDPEIIYMSKSNLLQICLVKTGETVPMISTLELRPLRNDSYDTKLGPLKLLERLNCASDGSGSIRYPDDVLDRKWRVFYGQNSTGVNTTLHVTSSTPFLVPDAVSRSGRFPSDSSAPFFNYVYLEERRDKHIFYLHFAEIEALSANETREFDIVLNGIVIHKAYSPKMLQSETKYNTSPQKCRFHYCQLSFERTHRSTLPPLVNAMEAFKVMDFLYAETNQNDVDAMRSIQAIYGLNMVSWQGDPCVPELLKWEGLKCRYTSKSVPPRIISLDLSSLGLKGVITPAIQNLTELQKLDLSNNSFTGGVPEFLASMKSLLMINLNWNDLSGPLPKALHEREMNGLKLSIQGNPKLSADASCKNKNQNYILAVVASAASVLFIIALF